MTNNTPLKIAMFGHKRVPSREGGVEMVVGELSVRMVSLGHSVTCYNRSGKHIGGTDFQKKQPKLYKGVRVKKVLTIDKKGLAAVSSSVFASIKCAFGRYDVVHIHAEGPAFMCWMPKLFRKKVVVTVHGLDHQRAKWGKFASKYIMSGEKNAVRFADEIIVLSEGVKKYFKDTYNRDTVFIPNGVNRPEMFSPELIKDVFDLDKDKYILFLGRLVPEKGLVYLINAFKKVKSDKKLVIAGGSSDTSDFEKEIKALASDDERIVFTGFVEGQTLSELYSNAYVYTLPSDLEGMPLSLLEAMSYGNCCLVSDIGECADVVEDKAVLFKKSDTEDLRKKLQQLCDDEELVNKYKTSAADYILAKYNWDNVAAETLKLYKK